MQINIFEVVYINTHTRIYKYVCYVLSEDFNLFHEAL